MDTRSNLILQTISEHKLYKSGPSIRNISNITLNLQLNISHARSNTVHYDGLSSNEN